MVMAMTRMLKYIEDMISHLLTCLLFFTNIPLAHPAGQFKVVTVLMLMISMTWLIIASPANEYLDDMEYAEDDDCHSVGGQVVLRLVCNCLDAPDEQHAGCGAVES